MHLEIPETTCRHPRIRELIKERSMRFRCARQAFTLVEMLIAITVLAILAAVLIPASDSRPAQSLQSLAFVLANDLRLARSQAIQSNSEWTIQFDMSENSYELLHTGSGSFPIPQNHLLPPSQQNGQYHVDLDQIGVVSEGDTGVQLAGAALVESDANVTDVTFGPLGGTGPTRSEDTLIVLTQGSESNMRSITLTVSWVTGQVWVGDLGPFIDGVTLPSQ